MKKFVSLTLWIISIYIAIVLFLSLALTQNSFYSFLTKTYTETNPSFELVQVNWHPSNPSVVLQRSKTRKQRTEYKFRPSFCRVFSGKFN